MTNIFYMQDHRPKNRSENRPKESPTLRDRFTAKKIVPADDKKKLAENLGKLAARINKKKPTTAAIKLLEDNNFHAPHRARYFTLNSDKRVANLARESQNYAKLIDAAGERLGWKERRVWKEALRGTSFCPPDALESLSSDNSWDFLKGFSDGMSKIISKETRLLDVWERLKKSPITFNKVDSSSSSSLLTAKIESYNILKRGFETAKYAQNTPEQLRQYNTEQWAYPIIRMGAIVKKISRMVFRVPIHLHEAFYNVKDEEWVDGEAQSHDINAINAWLDEIGSTKSDGVYELPDIPYNQSLGYGWVEREFLRRRSLWLEVRPKKTGEAGLYLFTQRDGIFCADQLIPQDDNVQKYWDKIIAVDDDVSPIDGLSDSSFFCRQHNDESLRLLINGVGTLFWPEWIGEINPDLKAKSMLGLVQNDYYNQADHKDDYDWTDSYLDGWLDEKPTEDQIEFIFDQKFKAFLDLEPSGENPYSPSNGFVAALYDHLKTADSERRLDHILVEQAKAICRAMDYYLEAINQDTEDLLDSIFKDYKDNA